MFNNSYCLVSIALKCHVSLEHMHWKICKPSRTSKITRKAHRVLSKYQLLNCRVHFQIPRPVRCPYTTFLQYIRLSPIFLLRIPNSHWLLAKILIRMSSFIRDNRLDKLMNLPIVTSWNISLFSFLNNTSFRIL